VDLREKRESEAFSEGELLSMTIPREGVGENNQKGEGQKRF